MFYFHYQRYFIQSMIFLPTEQNLYKDLYDLQQKKIVFLEHELILAQNKQQNFLLNSKISSSINILLNASSQIKLSKVVIYYQMKKSQNEDQFFKKMIQQKAQVNNTPIRTRTLIPLTKEKENSMLNNAKNVENKNIGLKVKQKKKTEQRKNCTNHYQKQAEFRIAIDSENIDYCNKCAAHLASQGFQVQRIIKPHDPKNDREQEITNFLSSLQHLEKTYADKLKFLKNINQSYQTQLTDTTNFYNYMIDYIQEIKQQHLRTIERQAIKNTQICQIQCGQINQTLEEIENMKDDVSKNLQSIIQQVQEENYRQCLQFYLQKIGLFNHRAEQLGVQAKHAPIFNEADNEVRLQDFKGYMRQITGFQSEQYEQQMQDSI